MTTCLREKSLQAYLDGELAMSAAAGVAAHLAGCACCAARARAAEEALATLADALDEDLPTVVPTMRMRARLDLALAGNGVPAYGLASLFQRLLRNRVAWAAAAVLAVASTGGWLASGPDTSARPAPSRPQLAQADSPSSSNPPDLQSPAPTSTGAQASPHRRRQLRHRAQGDSGNETEVVTEFFSLREGEEPAAAENLRIVRVELPASALGEAGLPVPPGAANVSVTADVLLGDDGLARAVRFVREGFRAGVVDQAYEFRRARIGEVNE